MGDPKQSRKLYRKPKRPWNPEQLMNELELLGTYGLRNKRELWKAETELSRIRHIARTLLALPEDIRIDKAKILLAYLSRIGLADDNSTLDDILSLKIEDVLERRLQTLVMKKYELKPNQARQMIVHRHIMINDRIVNIPGYLVRKDEEGFIKIIGK
ncbi:MAG: 30S ribosomal protein S4 [Candidatus Nitrosocaldaceae archaeon]